MLIIEEIANKITQIQSGRLRGFHIHDLNDKINKLFREQRYWETEIKKLGESDYSRICIIHERCDIPTIRILLYELRRFCNNRIGNKIKAQNSDECLI